MNKPIFPIRDMVPEVALDCPNVMILMKKFTNIEEKSSEVNKGVMFACRTFAYKPHEDRASESFLSWVE